MMRHCLLNASSSQHGAGLRPATTGRRRAGARARYEEQILRFAQDDKRLVCSWRTKRDSWKGQEDETVWENLVALASQNLRVVPGDLFSGLSAGVASPFAGAGSPMDWAWIWPACPGCRAPNPARSARRISPAKKAKPAWPPKAPARMPRATWARAGRCRLRCASRPSPPSRLGRDQRLRRIQQIWMTPPGN